MIRSVVIERDEEGFGYHPDLPDFGEILTDEQRRNFEAENGCKLEVVLFEDFATSDDLDRWGCYGSCLSWTPQSSFEGSVLLSIHDTEDGPCAWFAVPSVDETTRQRCAREMRNNRDGDHHFSSHQSW